MCGLYNLFNLIDFIRTMRFLVNFLNEIYVRINSLYCFTNVIRVVFYDLLVLRADSFSSVHEKVFRFS